MIKPMECPRCKFVPQILRSSRWFGKWIFYIRIRGFRLMLDKDQSMKRKWFFTESGATRYWNRWVRRELRRMKKEDESHE